jgi:hypothetical protein
MLRKGTATSTMLAKSAASSALPIWQPMSEATLDNVSFPRELLTITSSPCRTANLATPWPMKPAPIIPNRICCLPGA